MLWCQLPPPLTRATFVRRHAPQTRLGVLGAFLLGACGQTQLSASRLEESDPSVGLDDGAASGGAAISDNPPLAVGEGGAGPVPQQPPPYAAAPTLFSQGGSLRDHCGEPIVLRGVSEFIGWTEGGDGEPEFFEIATVGANAVRIMWRSEEAPEALGPVIERARGQGLIPVVDLHETFTSIPESEAFERVLDYWLDPRVVEVLLANQQSLIVELSSWAAPSSPLATWLDLYEKAIAAFRAAGLRMPIAVAEPSWGQADPEQVATAMTQLVSRDSAANLLVAYPFWGGTAASLASRLGAFSLAGVASYISEFSEYHIRDCPDVVIDVDGILTEAARLDGSWFAWSWGSVPNAGACVGYLDMTTDGTVETMTPFGALVALEHPGGISRSAVALRTDPQTACPR